MTTETAITSESLNEKTDKQRRKLGLAGKKYIAKNYSFEKFEKSWVEFMEEVLEENGSWDTRKNYKAWEQIQL